MSLEPFPPLSGFDTRQALALIRAATERATYTETETDELNTAFAWIADALDIEED